MNVFLLVVALAAPVEVPKTGLPAATAASAAVASEAVLPEADAVSAAKSGESSFAAATPVKATATQAMSVLPAAVSGGPCTLVEIYAKRRMLSGPWSVTRRLEAARIRGDENEARRMEAMLDDFVGKALEVEGTEQ